MTDEAVRNVAEWIAHDPSDFAQRCRAFLRPRLESLVNRLDAARIEAFAGCHDHHRRSIMRRKLRSLRWA